MENKGLKNLSITIFVLVMVLPILFFIYDIVTFSETILAVIGAIFVSCITFFILFILFLLSIILVFGISIAENGGFWPLSATLEIYNGLMKEIEISPSQIDMFVVGKFISLVFFLVLFILAIVALAKYKRRRKENNEYKSKLVKSFSTLTLIFSLFQILGSIGIIVIMANVM